MIMQRSCPEVRRLRELIDGELPEPEQAELTRHLDTCAACQETLESLAAGSESWCETARQLGPEPSRLDPDLCRVVHELQEEIAGPDDPKASPGMDTTFAFLSPSDQPGHLGRLGQYEVLEVIGRGGMGVVFKALDPALNRFVAIKVLAPQFSTSAAARKRFAREARAAAAVSHDHIVAIHAVEETREMPYLVMQYVSGSNLQERLDRSAPLELKEVLRIGLQTAAGLAAAHAQGLIHRDVKPANILLENGVERVKLTDFGLARAVDDASLTQSGTVAGTPQYMAPEQARGDVLDHRADLFSLGSVLYAMCTGHPPFRASTTMAVLKRVSDDAPRPIREINPDVPEWLVRIVEVLHAKNPDDRFASAAEVSALLEQCLAHVQQPAVVPLPRLPARKLPSPPTQASGRAGRKGRWLFAGALVALLLGWLGVTEATGDGPVRQLLSTVLRIVTPNGTLVLEIEDADVRVDVDGEGVVIRGVGLQEVRLRTGAHHVQATRDNQIVLDGDITIARGDRTVVRIRREGPPTVSRAVVDPARPKPRPDRQPSSYAARGGFPGELAPVAPAPVPGRRAVWSIAFAPDGQTLAAGSSGTGDSWGDVQLLDVAQGVARARAREEKTVRSVAYAPDGKTLATGEFDRTAKLRDAATGQVRMILRGHAAAVNAVAYSPDGRLLATASFDKTVKLWDTATGQEVRTLAGHEKEVYCVAFAPDGKSVLSGGDDHTARLWDVETGRLRFTLEGHTHVVEGVACSPDGKLVATASWDRTVKLWDPAAGQLVATLPGHTLPVLCAAFSPDGKLLATGGGRWGDANYAPGPGEVKVWDVASRRCLDTLGDHPDRVFSVAFAPDGRTLASVSWDGTVKLRHAADRAEWATLHVPDGMAVDFGMPQPAGRRWLARELTPVGKPARKILTGHADWVWNAAFLPDGRHALSAGQDHTVRLWDVASGQELRRFEGHTSAVIGLAVSADGKRALTSDFDDAVRLWDVESGQELRRFEGHTQPVISVALAADGRRALTGSWDGTVRLWDVATGQELRRLTGHADQVEGVALSPDGRQALSCGHDRTVRLWDVEEGRELQRFDGRSVKFLRVAFSPDGRRAAATSEDGTVRLWDLAAAKEVQRFDGHTDMATGVAFSPDGRRLLTGSQDQTVRLWDVESGKQLELFTGHTGPVWSVAFSADGRQAISAGHDRTVRLWDIP